MNDRGFTVKERGFRVVLPWFQPFETGFGEKLVLKQTRNASKNESRNRLDTEHGNFYFERGFTGNWFSKQNMKSTQKRKCQRMDYP